MAGRLGMPKVSSIDHFVDPILACTQPRFFNLTPLSALLERERGREIFILYERTFHPSIEHKKTKQIDSLICLWPTYLQ